MMLTTVLRHAWPKFSEVHTGVFLQGLAKRVALNDLPQKNRGGAGYYLLKTNEGDRLVALHIVGSAGTS